MTENTDTRDVFIALGSNVGDREANLEDAIERISGVVDVTKRSRLYQSAPMYVTDQPAFLNMALKGRTALSAEELLKALKDLEAEIGRRPTFRNGPRVIDLDILYFGDQRIDTETLSVPHPRIAERGFVLYPLNDIDPQWLDVRTGRTIAEMVQTLGPDGSLEVLR